MSSSSLILLMIGVCLCFLLFLLLARPIKFALKCLIRGIAGLGAAWALNFLLSPLGIGIGLNALNAVIIGLMGIPGFALLYILTALL